MNYYTIKDIEQMISGVKGLNVISNYKENNNLVFELSNGFKIKITNY